MRRVEWTRPGTSGQWHEKENVVEAKQIVLPCLFHHMPDEEGEEETKAKAEKKKKEDENVSYFKYLKVENL